MATGAFRASVKDHVFMVTGANSGIGYATAHGLAKLGATVIMAARSREKGENARQQIVSKTGNDRVHLLLADLSSIAQTKRLAAEIERGFDRLDGLINNAALVPPTREVTEDGLEAQFAINHLSYFILGNLLLPMLIQTANRRGDPTRIVNVSSNLHEAGSIDFSDLQAERQYKGAVFGAGGGRYGDTKLMNVLFTYELARRLGNHAPVIVNALHPGLIATNLTRYNLPSLMRPFFSVFAGTPKRGAQTSIYLATSPDVRNMTGRYFVDSKLTESSSASHDIDAARRLWDISAQLAGIETPISMAV